MSRVVREWNPREALPSSFHPIRSSTLHDSSEGSREQRAAVLRHFYPFIVSRSLMKTVVSKYTLLRLYGV